MHLETIQSFFFLALELTFLFLVISFFIQFIEGYIPYDRMQQLLAERHPLIGAIIAVMFAFVTPFCSCSTIPVVVSLLNKNVRFGLVMIFLFASPVLDPTILTLMTALLGIKVAVVYTLLTAMLSILIGFMLEAFGFERAVKRVIVKGNVDIGKKRTLKEAWHETLHLMKTVYPYLLLGAGIGAFIHGVVPTDWISTYMGGDTWWLVPLAAIIGIPFYIRLSTMIPISQMLLAKGMALGPMIALMISSAGASLPEITLLHSIFHKKLVWAFIASVISMATLSGFLFYII
ncbi:permease [Anoxybacillus gonensis]|uniref:Permease n=1 Tax=Anoxybacillus gonensis TaxID=198467 RepID=A0AAW7TK88_9BACL|nr:permease [Anoxybacillus gonensis]AKS38125.1 permease [Anoxybacillus gonensis]KGP61013.1 permease [Anoxybacillus gonensis]MDO0877205.1 permease [Anoxybacillus gonensis]